MDERILYYIWLSNVLHPGNKSIKPLFEAFGTIKNIYNAQNKEYLDAGIKQSDATCLCSKDLSLAKSQYNYCKSEKIGFLCYDDPYYPERLRIIENPPCMFYYRGRLAALDDYPCVAMVGTRKCSPDGYRFAYRTAYCAASGGIVIVNGLAAGIDGACIAAALDANAYAVGLLGCGIDRIYPLSNKDLFYRLSASGLILTEFPPFTEPKGANFPVRNRVISALCLGSAIFEADAERSGAMITAEYAKNQGRQIFAVPGSPDDKSYSGGLELIKDGAIVLTDADDILTEYSMLFPHRINTRHRVQIPEQKLELYVESYFGNKSTPKKTDTSDSNRAYKKNKPFEAAINEAPKIDANVEKLATKPVRSDNTEIATQQEQRQSDNISKPEKHPPIRDISLLSTVERQIYDMFEEKQVLSADEIVATGIKIQDVLSTLTLLEVYSLIKAVPGGRFEFSN